MPTREFVVAKVSRILMKKVQGPFATTGRFVALSKDLCQGRFNRCAARFGDMMIGNVAIVVVFTIAKQFDKFLRLVQKKDWGDGRRHVVGRYGKFRW